MKCKIYESNNLKKYTHKNEDFNTINFPEYLNKPMNNELAGKKSFTEKSEIPQKEYLKNTIDYLRTSYKNTNFNDTNSNLYSNEIEDQIQKKNKLFYTSDNYLNDKNQKNSGFSEFLEKKNIYERLSDLKDSIGKKEINSPIYLNSIGNSKKDKKETEEMYIRVRENILNTLNTNERSGNLNLNLQRSIGHLNNRESLENSILSTKSKINVDENNSNYYLGSYSNKEIKNRSSSLFSIKNLKNKDQDSFVKNKDISKVNVLHKLDQYREYFKFKGL